MALTGNEGQSEWGEKGHDKLKTDTEALNWSGAKAGQALGKMAVELRTNQNRL